MRSEGANAADELLTRLRSLYVVAQALLAYADRAPAHVKPWAEKELAAVLEILERLSPQAAVGIGGGWPLKK